MSSWRPLSGKEIEAELAGAVSRLHPTHARLFSQIRVRFRLVPVAAHPGERVWVVAEHQGRILYYSDIEDGWAIDRPDSAGGIADRDCSQFELTHLMWQLFGDPERLAASDRDVGLITFVANQFGEDGSLLRSYFTCLYRGCELPALPWGDELFDCVLISADHDETRRLARSFADEIVKHSVDWVQTTGAHAEWIHDCIDWASVAAGVQDAIGDGCPMTSWHDEAVSMDEASEVAEYCLGSADRVLCVVVGSVQDERAFIELLRDRLG